MSIIERLTSLFAPDDCLVCGNEGTLLCRGCFKTLPPLIGRCFGCRQPIAGPGCNDCLRLAGLNSLAVAARYGGPAKALVARLKFSGNQSAARLMADAMLAVGALPPGALLVHMPATTAHVRERGFDQSQLIVRQLSRRSGLPHAGSLRRQGQQHQLGADRNQRLLQLSSALSVRRRGLVRGKHIILVDDVVTTGSSLTAAAAVLQQAGASRVDALVFAQSLK